MRVALLTPLQNLQRNYSVCTVVLQQVKMLEAAGHEVTVFVKKGFNTAFGTIPNIHKTQLPGFQLKDKKAGAHQMKKVFGEGLLDPFDVIFTHDFMFLPMLETYREGVKLIVASKKAPKAKWFHWSHSVPRRLPAPHRGLDGHIYVALIAEQQAEVARMYAVPVDRVPVCWNPIDVTESMPSAAAAKLVQDLRLLDCDVLGVLPFSMGRLEGKGVQRAVSYYIALAERYRVKLILCNARSKSPKQKKRKAKFAAEWKKAAEGKQFQLWWTSDIRPKWADCVPNEVIRDLQRIANLFIYPTIGEANSLAIAEAMTGGGLCVLPESRIAGMKELSDPGVFLCYWQEGDWKAKKFKPAAEIAREIEGFGGGVLGVKIHELRRKWRYSRLRIWQDQMQPMLETHTGQRW